MSTSQTGYIEGQIHKHPALRICFFLMVLLWPFGHRHAASQDQLPLSEQLVGGEFSYVVQKGDSLTGIGARFGVDAGVLAGGNHLSLSSRLQVGQQLRVDNRHIVPNILSGGIVINIPQSSVEDSRLLNQSLHKTSFSRPL